MGLTFETGIESAIPVIAFAGELDGVSVDHFENAILDVARDNERCVIVDLTDVTYIDSQSFGRLLKSHIFLEQEGGDIAIVSGPSNTSRIIKMFGADYLLAVFPDRPTAAEYLIPLVAPSDSAV